MSSESGASRARGLRGVVITTLAGRTKVIAFGSESSRKLKARTVGYPPQSATGLSRLVLAEPASRERLHCSLSRGRKAVHSTIPRAHYGFGESWTA